MREEVCLAKSKRRYDGAVLAARMAMDEHPTIRTLADRERRGPVVVGRAARLPTAAAPARRAPGAFKSIDDTIDRGPGSDDVHWALRPLDAANAAIAPLSPSSRAL